MKRPDLFAILQHSYACGLPRHWKDTQLLINYIEHLETQINDKGDNMNIDLTDYRKRTEYPSDGAVVVEIIKRDDGKLTIVYDDRSYLTVKKVAPR